MFASIKEKIFGVKNSSKALAKNRLHFVLVQDRAGLTNEEMSSFRAEMLKVIEKFFVIDKKGFDISYERMGDMTTLLINSPILVKKQSIGDAQLNSNKVAVNANQTGKKSKTGAERPLPAS